MAYTRGRCTNFDYCSIADARRDAEVTVGDDFVCPECGKPLSAPPVAAGGNAVMFGLVGAGVLVLVGGAIYLGIRLGENGRRAAPQAPVAQMVQPAPATPIQAPVRTAAVTSSAPPVVPPPAPSETTLFRMSGSGDAAASLAPALAAAYLTDIGDTDIRTVPATAATSGKITGQRGDHAEAILVSGTDAA
ncbi:MAG TPA: hypothetical protein VMB71_01475, partial [Acetobacteraceae bacterium]|nr:hypothetical protein [Acetobacteraceae bacterium]